MIRNLSSHQLHPAPWSGYSVASGPRYSESGKTLPGHTPMDSFDGAIRTRTRPERGFFLPKKTLSERVTDTLGWLLTRPVRLIGQVVASVLPLSILTDMLVFPGTWAGASESSLRENRDILQRYWGGTRVSIPVSDYSGVTLPSCCSELVLDGMYFAAPHEDTKKTVIYCNPNYDYYETNLKIVEYYRNKLNVNLLLFNYRGVGASEGRPTTARTIKDMGDIYQYLVQTTGIEEGDVLVHGRSVGGVHAAALAAKHPKMTLVCDRAFSGLSSAAYGMFGGGFCASIVAGLAYLFSASSMATSEFYQKVKGPKLCVADLNDEMFKNFRGCGGDVVDLNIPNEQTHNNVGFTLTSPLFNAWLRNRFLRGEYSNDGAISEGP